jgi:hypothetical protein
MTFVDVSDRWADRSHTLEILGISNAALILLQRDGVLPPDCVTCGRIRWKITELHARRDEVRQYLIDRYGTLSGSLIQYSESAKIGVSK